LAGGEYALAILNRSGEVLEATIDLASLGLSGNYEAKDLWQHKVVSKSKKWKAKVNIHETLLLRLKPLTK